MGNRSRYQPSYDRERALKHYAEVMGRGDKPTSLSEEELGRPDVAVTRSPTPIAVAAWVHYGLTPVRVNGFTNTWTARAVEVYWRSPKGDTHSAWVWRNAIQPREISNEERLLGHLRRG